MKERSFYVTLPSNASLKAYPKNTKANYTTLLEEAIDINSKYEVALVEISNFSSFFVEFGHITYENPLNFFLMGKRPSKIELKLNIKNGITLIDFCKSINTAIFQNFIKTEYLYRYQQAFKEGKANNNNNNKMEERVLTLFKKSVPVESFELHYHDQFKFHDEIREIGGILDSKMAKYVFNNIEKLSENFDLNIQKCPDFEIDESVFMRESFFYDKFKLFSEDYLLLRKSSKISPSKIFSSINLPNDFKKIMLEKFKEINTENIQKGNRVFSFNLPYSDFLPKLNALEANILEIRTYTETKFVGLISKLITNSNLESYICYKNEIFSIPENIQTIKSVAIYSDIIESQYFGDVRSQILRVLNIKSSNLEDTLHIVNPHYLNVKCSRISSINIEICDITGKSIKYFDNFSSLNITLHFRIKI